MNESDDITQNIFERISKKKKKGIGGEEIEGIKGEGKGREEKEKE